MIAAQERAMPITDAIIVAAIIFAFIVFGIVLAWGEYQTRHLSRPDRPSGNTGDEKRRPIKTIQAHNSAFPVEGAA
jgi:hypothetical protein